MGVLETGRRPAASGRRDDVMPWATALASCAVVASFGVGATRWFGIGATVGIVAGAACAWLTFRSVLRRRSEAHARELAALAADGDSRVETVIRQFEWAVDDVVRLKGDLESANTAAHARVARVMHRERYVEQLEQELIDARERLAEIVLNGLDVETTHDAESTHDAAQTHDLETELVPIAVPFRWALHNDGYRWNLELECGVGAHRPTRVRIVDGSGDVLMVSGTPMRFDGGGSGFTLANPPADLVADLGARRECSFHLEALVDHEWRQVSLEDSGRRTKVTYDKQGRVYRVSDDAEAAPLVARTLG